MAMKVTDDCINCKACAVECQAGAICETSTPLKVNRRKLTLPSIEYFFILVSQCDECSDFINIKCISICPMDAIRQYN